MGSSNEIQKTDLRAKVLRSAVHEFTENGYRGATVKMIADGAGVSVGAVMKYYGSKEELLISIMEKYTLTGIFTNCVSTEPYDVFSLYLDYLRKVLREDPDHFEFCTNLYMSYNLPKTVYERLVSEFYGSPIEKAIIESQRRNELPACSPVDMYKLLYRTATSMMVSYARIGIEQTDNDAILSAISYKPVDPETERAIREIKSDRSLLMSAIENTYPFSVSCNVTQNAYHVITTDNRLEPRVEPRGTYDELVKTTALTLPNLEQREKYIALFGRQSVLDAFGRGERVLGLFHLQSPAAGEERWMRMKGVLSRAANGDILLLCIAGPLSSDYRTEFELQKAREENETAQLMLARFASNYSSVFVLDTDTAEYELMKTDSDDAEKTKGCPYGELTARFISSSVAPSYRELMTRELSIERIRERVSERHGYILDFQRVKNGVTYWEQMRVRPLTRNKIAIGLLNNDEYMTKSKTQEVIYNQYVAVYLLDLDSGMMTIQKKPDAVTELKAGGRYVWSEICEAFIARVTRDTSGDVESFGDTEAIRSRLTDEGHAECLYKLPGRDRWRKLSAEPYEYSGGKAVKAVICIRELENSESEKIDLSERVMAQQEELELALEREKRANESKSEFLSTMAHEIMTPLNHIKGMTYIARKNVDDREKVLDSLKNIDSAEEALQLLAEKALKIIDTPLGAGSLKLSELLRNKKILVVDDNRMNREILTDILNEQDIDTEEAENGAYAVRMLLDKGPDYYDAVLMDINMPVMDGYVATRTIRQMYPGSGLPIIAVSANSSYEDRQLSKEAGMDAHLAKPLDIVKLKEILSGMNGRR